MLRRLFEWFDYHPAAYWGIAALASLALAGWIAAAVFRPDAPGSRRRSWVYGLLLFLFLLAWRWPYLFAANEYNPDESQLIAGAITLFHDPVPWRSLDVATSGPLNYYALFPLHLVGLPFDYFAARLTALLLVWGALLACRRLFASHGAPAAAELAVLPAAVFFAAASEGDLVHYSSEHVPLFLMALSAACLFARPPGVGSVRQILAAGLVAGLLPWSKLQAAPLMLVLGGIRLGQVLLARDLPSSRRGREAGYLLAGAAIPTVVACGVLAATGQLEVFWRSYLQANVDYVRDAPPLNSLVWQFFEVSRERGHLPAFWTNGLLALALGAAAYALTRQRPGRLFLIGAAGSACAVACVLLPQRPLQHYLLLTIMPLTWWMAAAVVECWPRLSGARRLLLLVFALGAFFPLGWRGSQEDPDEIGRLAEDWRHPRSALGNLIRAHSTPQDSLAVWGWWPALYVDSGLRQATHDGNTAWSMHDAPISQRDYYQTRYLQDLAANRPLFFIDAVGPDAPFFTDRSLAGHELFPGLARFVADNYRLWLDRGAARLYLRNDVALPPVPSAAALAELDEKARRGVGLAASRPSALVPASAPRWSLRGVLVQMMLPETKVEWRLDGSERAVWLDYGFHPRAVREGEPQDADFIVELATANQAPQLLFQRRLAPRLQAGDRGPLTSRLVLPPFGPDSRLIVRTSPGTNGDDSWDWVYLQRVRFLRSRAYQPEQFPGFNRAPDQLAGERVALIDGADGRYLSLHPPAALQFTLTGAEKSLAFDFGFEAGAYTGGGQTDGAVFFVERRRAGSAPVELFRRPLHPVGEAADRGRQHAQVNLPDVRAGDELFLRLDPGASDSWDWTYVSDLTLQ